MIQERFAVNETERSLRVISENNKVINAFCEVFAEEAIRDAKRSDERRRAGELLSSLDGVPFAVKDNLAVKGHISACGGKYLRKYVSPYTATAVELLQNAGMILLGRLNMDEFGMGSHTTHSVYGVTRNPWNTECSAGGSSGGAAAAVASGMIQIALGSDTGGSIRLPASFCGVTGFKPAYGAVSRYGLTAFASSLDCVGVLAKSVSVACEAANLLCVKDPRDATSVGSKKIEISEMDLAGVKIGYWDGSMLRGACEQIRSLYDWILSVLSREGAQLAPFVIYNSEKMIAAYYLISSCEASSNLARYEGVRYGERDLGQGSLEEMMTASRSLGFGDEVKRRLMMGAFSLSSGFFEEYYMKATATREETETQMKRILRQCDFLVTPAACGAAPKISETEKAPSLRFYTQDIFTVPQSLAGLPSICVPCGRIEGMPAGLCVTTLPDRMDTLWNAAHMLEKLKLTNQGG